MSKRPSIKLSAVAARYATTTRTVSRWKAQGAPLDNPGAMQDWLVGRKHLPEGTREQLAGQSRKRISQTAFEADESSLKTGVAAALERLESAERTAFEILQGALKDGNVLEIKLAREGWLRVSESLRRYDLAIEQSRRNASELVPREQVEHFAYALVTNLKCTVQMITNSLARRLAGATEADILTVLRRELFRELADVFTGMAAQRGEMQVPPWLIRAALKPIANGGVTELVEMLLPRERESAQP